MFGERSRRVESGGSKATRQQRRALLYSAFSTNKFLALSSLVYFVSPQVVVVGSVGRTIITGCRRPLSPFAHPSSASQYTNSLNRILWLRSACVSLALYARRLGRAPIKRSHQKNILGCILISKLVRMGERGARGRNGQRECAHFAKKEWWFAYRSRATGFARVIINIIMSMYSEHYHYT